MSRGNFLFFGRFPAAGLGGSPGWDSGPIWPSFPVSCHRAEGYEKKKELQDKMDFDDILTECYALLEQEKRLRKAWQNRFDVILVDEFQDINAIQYACVKLLLDERNNLFAVGDDDQSIYGFRGSNPSFLLDFLRYLGSGLLK